jgi:MFS family permease
MKDLTQKQVKGRVFIHTFYMVLLSWISIKIVLPALPGLPDYLQCTSNGVKLSVSLYLFAYAFSQPLWGGLSHKYGAKKMLILGVSLSTLGTIIVLLSSNLPLYILGRSLEGLGIGCISPITRSIITQSFNKKELASKMAVLSGVAASMPAISPIIGSWLMGIYNWKVIFGFMLLISLFGLILTIIYLPQNSKLLGISEHSWIRNILKSYYRIITNRLYWGYITPYAVMTGGLIGYYSASPFWFIKQQGFNERTASYFLLPTVALYILGLIVTRILINKHSLEKIQMAGLLIAVFVVLLSFVLTVVGLKGTIPIIILFSLYGFAGGFVFPTSNAAALIHFKEHSALAAALISCTVFGTSSLTSTITMKMDSNILLQQAIYMGFLALLGIFVFYLFVYRKRSGKIVP